ncbi:MAG TPA: hypothetical protein VGN39_03310 [Terriglobales bacterium]|jgi:hypothetical protein|nr:hypothetical protein [Terriglobales bacterium]
MHLFKHKVWVYLLLGFVVSLPAFVQAAENGGQDLNPTAETHFGYPQDWSSRHIVMTGNDDSAALKAGVTEPRHVYNMVMRRAAIEASKRRRRPRKNAMKVDWAVSLENGFVPANQSPAKYGFDVTKESCNNDFVLLGLTVVSGVQANIVGINNLYTEAIPKCNSGTPWVSFAYNTVTQGGGKITTSPSISEDGTKVAFVETATAGSYFHVLVLPNPIPVPPSQTGTVRAPATPSSCAKPTTVNCMTTVQISAAGTPTSPWIDYSTDTAYVGTGDGKLYKISPVFGGGTPVVAADANWPVIVSTATFRKVLTNPTVDDNEGRIFIGDGSGFLYAINLANPGKTTAATLSIGWTTEVPPGNGIGIVDPPIVVSDISNPAIDQVFAFTGCSSVVGIGGAISQLPANFTSATVVDATNTVDLGSGSGNGDCTTGNVHAGDFDNQFWLNGSAKGHIIACGFVSGTGNTPLIPSNPKIYMYPFNGGVLNDGLPAVPTTTWVVNSSKGDECSPLIEFFDGTTDRLFFGVGGTGDGFVKSSSITAGLPASTSCSNGSPTSTCVTTPSKLGGASSIVVDNQVANGGANLYFSTLAPGSVNGQNCHAAGGIANPYCAVKLTQSALQ